MSVIRTPSERSCVQCGRDERWNPDQGSWEVAAETGSVRCIHDWDITGSFTPVER
ncbi:HEWD family protein [Halocalculus aciditolerans]|uniref:HEWD family protein n=1 Tax=Halocalculus aciditolerans TaxID=1383812 RepID=UPI001669AB0C|nr:HEWD family protein [Halocalculus aciditolerans]